MSNIRVLIVDDQASFRWHLRQLLTHAGLLVIGEAGDMPEARELAQSLQPDLAVVDVGLSGENGLSGTPQLIALAPHMRVILISAQDDSGQMLEKSAAEAGAAAYVAKDDLELELVMKWVEKMDEGRDSDLMKLQGA